MHSSFDVYIFPQVANITQSFTSYLYVFIFYNVQDFISQIKNSIPLIGKCDCVKVCDNMSVLLSVDLTSYISVLTLLLLQDVISVSVQYWIFSDVTPSLCFLDLFNLLVKCISIQVYAQCMTVSVYTFIQVYTIVYLYIHCITFI